MSDLDVAEDEIDRGNQEKPFFRGGQENEGAPQRWNRPFWLCCTNPGMAELDQCSSLCLAVPQSPMDPDNLVRHFDGHTEVALRNPKRGQKEEHPRTGFVFATSYFQVPQGSFEAALGFESVAPHAIRVA
jgi:hypothetical protein